MIQKRKSYDAAFKQQAVELSKGRKNLFKRDKTKT